MLSYPGEANFGEGVLLYEGWRVAHGKSLYLDPAQPPFWMATYPPLYQLLSALAGGSSFLWPRLVSLIAGCVSAASLALVVRRLGQSWAIAVLAMLLWFNSLFIDIWCALARVDMTGRAFCSAAVAIAICVRRDRIAMAAALVCCVLAMLVKQNMIAGGLTCTVIFGIRQRRLGIIFLTLWLAVTAAAYLGLNVATKGWFWKDIFQLTSRELSFSTMRGWVGAFLETHALYLVSAAAGILTLVSAGRKELWILLTAMAAGIPNALLSGNDGADRNYFFDLIWPLCALAAVGAGTVLSAKATARIAGSFAVLALLANAVLLMRGPTEYASREQAHSAEAIIAKLKQVPHPVLCELTGFTLLAGSDVEYLPYMLRKLEADGRWNPAPVVRRLNQKQYGGILLTHHASQRFGAEIMQAIQANYDVAEVFENQFLAEGGGKFVLLKPTSIRHTELITN